MGSLTWQRLAWRYVLMMWQGIYLSPCQESRCKMLSDPGHCTGEKHVRAISWTDGHVAQRYVRMVWHELYFTPCRILQVTLPETLETPRRAVLLSDKETGVKVMVKVNVCVTGREGNIFYQGVRSRPLQWGPLQVSKGENPARCQWDLNQVFCV